MTDRPILFSADMVQALLAGRKTQTRRGLKLKGYPGFYDFGASDTRGYDWHFRRSDGVWCDFRHADLMKLLPVQVIDRLWVRETWAPLDALTHNDPGSQALCDGCFYRADNGTVDGEISKWTPSIYMPKALSRLTLCVTDVRVERLQDISEADAIAEGVIQESRPNWHHDRRWHDYSGEADYFLDPRNSFRTLWYSLNGPDAWDQNPWVAAYTFTVHKHNIDREAI